MTTKTLFLSILILCISTTAFTQLKITATGGVSNNLQSKPDSLFFAKKSGGMLRFNAAYYWGRIGLGTTFSTVKKTALPAAETTIAPNIADTIRLPGSVPIKQGGIRTTIIALGPEICFCYKKLKIMPSVKVGIAMHKAENTELELRPNNTTGAPRLYGAALEEKNSIALGLTTTVAYKLSSNLGFALSLDYWSYKVKTLFADFRTGTNTPRSVKQAKRILNVGAGLYFNIRTD